MYEHLLDQKQQNLPQDLPTSPKAKYVPAVYYAAALETHRALRAFSVSVLIPHTELLRHQNSQRHEM